MLCFIEETREYIAGKLRVGETMGGKEIGELIRTFKKYLPGCVKRVVLRGDGEFISWESVEAAIGEGYCFIFGNKRCNPQFESKEWYKVKKKDKVEYNECIYQPMGWDQACRFVVMRIPKEEEVGVDATQLKLFKDREYVYRIFVTNMTWRPHEVIPDILMLTK